MVLVRVSHTNKQVSHPQFVWIYRQRKEVAFRATTHSLSRSSGERSEVPLSAFLIRWESRYYLKFAEAHRFLSEALQHQSSYA